MKKTATKSEVNKMIKKSETKDKKEDKKMFKGSTAKQRTGKVKTYVK